MIQKFFLITRRVFLVTFGITAIVFAIFVAHSSYLMSHDGWSIVKKYTLIKPCALYGEQSVDHYMQTYVVKKGDTLLSIAEHELGDRARIQELIAYNQKIYPELGDNPTTLAPGMALHMFPRQFPPFLFPNKVLTGLLVTARNGRMEISHKREGNSVLNFGYGPETAMIGKKTLGEGDCVAVFFQNEGAQAVVLQDYVVK
jgi:hypothetical protein